jgi:hypothetical protein
MSQNITKALPGLGVAPGRPRPPPFAPGRPGPPLAREATEAGRGRARRRQGRGVAPQTGPTLIRWPG